MSDALVWISAIVSTCALTLVVMAFVTAFVLRNKEKNEHKYIK